MFDRYASGPARQISKVKPKRLPSPALMHAFLSFIFSSV